MCVSGKLLGQTMMPADGSFRMFSLMRTKSAAFAICMLMFVAASGVPKAQAQYVGYSVNGSQVSIFAVVTNDTVLTNEDSILQTVSLGTSVGSALAVTPDPHPTKAYVTGSNDNSLWVIDTSDLGDGNVTAVTAKNVNPGNILNLDAPSAIVIVMPAVGPNQGHAIAYIANSGTNTITAIDTSTNTVVGSPIQLPNSAYGTQRTPTKLSVDDANAASFIGVETNDSADVSLFASFGGALTISLADNSITDNGEIYFGATYLTYGAGVATAETTDGGGTSHLFQFYGSTGIVGTLDGITFNPSCINIAQRSPDNQPCLAIYDSDAQGINESLTLNASTVGFCNAQEPCYVNALTAFVNKSSGQNLVTVYAAVRGTSLFPYLFQITIDCSGSTCAAPVVSSPLNLALSASAYPSLALTPDELLLYIGAASTSTSNAQIVNTTNFCVEASGCANASVVPISSSTAMQISNMDASSKPIEFFIGGPLPPAVPANQSLTVLGMAMMNPANSVGMNLSFSLSGTVQCELFAEFNGSSGNQCSVPSQQAEAAIGGTTSYTPPGASGLPSARGSRNAVLPRDAGSSLPAGGTLPISVMGTGSNGTQSMTSQPVTAGAGCTLTSSATTVETGQPVDVTLACTAPNTEKLLGTINWGDTSTPTSVSGTTANYGLTLPYTGQNGHSYTTPSKTGYTISATLQDNTEGNIGSVTPSSIVVTVTPAPTNCSLEVSPTTAQIGQMVTGTVACTAIPGDTLTGTVTWGDSSTPSPITMMVGTTGMASLSATHTYSKAGSPTYSVTASISDTTASVSGSVSNSPASVTITSQAPAPSCALAVTPATATTGQGVTANLSCNGIAGDSLGGTINWGDGTSPGATTGTVSGNGAVQLQLVHSYTTGGNFNIGGTVTDATSSLVGTVTPASVAIVITAPSSGPTITTSQSSESVTEGQPAQYPLTFAGGAGDANITFTLACQGPLPTGISCTFTPSAVTLDSKGNGTSQLSIATTGPTAVGRNAFPAIEKKTTVVYAGVVLFPWLAFVGLAGRVRPKRMKTPGTFCVLALVCFCALVCIGCGGSTPNTTPSCTTCTVAGTYNVTVTATSTNPALTSSTKVQLVVSQ